MKQWLNYYLNNMLMSAFLRQYATNELVCNGYVLYIIQNGWTPLMVASFNGHADIVQTLIEAKAQVDTQEKV